MPAFTPAPEDMKRLFAEALADFPSALERKMFGYPAAFVNGNLAAGLFQEDMFLRLSDEDRAAFRGEYKARLFEPVAGRPMRGYVLVPRYVLNSHKLLRMWLGKATAYTATLPPKVPRAKGKKQS
jgi:TfoX/Sxy family transcriptional regulator of competence genes